MSGKRYHAKNPNAVPPVHFELVVWRDEQEEVHEFTARPIADAAALHAFAMSGDDLQTTAKTVFGLMSRMLVNNDGVPSGWIPRAVPKPKNAGASYEPKFRGPDGKLHPMDDAEYFTDPAKGSSRRRWDFMMYEDDNVTVDLDVIMEIMEDLIYQRVVTLLGATRDPLLGHYIRGRLALAGIDSRADIGPYCAAIWAILLEAPSDQIKAVQDQLIVSEAIRNPEKARETWGLLPEHQRGAKAAEQMQVP
jgi:hypothetical protein